MEKKKNRNFIYYLFILIPILLIGCAQERNEETDGIKVVATTTMLTDLVETIGGEDLQITGLMGPGIDPHGYQASASDVNHMYEAEIVVYNGMDLEGQMGRVFSELTNLDKTVFALENIMETSEMLDSDEETMVVDPHIWFSVPLWQRSADYIAQSLAEYNPGNAEEYYQNNEAYQEKLAELDTYIQNRVEEVPESSRYLVTAHDAFQYFGMEYGFDVIGLQGLNTQTEAGTRDVSQLAQFIVENEIKAIFIETSVPTRTIESLQEAVRQRGWNVEVGGELHSDSLGDTSQNAETYLKMYKQNIDTIVEALK